MRKETVIQFGEGGFLRGFADYFFQKMQDKGLFDGSVVIVQPIEKGAAYWSSRDVSTTCSSEALITGRWWMSTPILTSYPGA
jgi:mannitol-1-phosphate/altronate dehydrogenase